MGRQGGPARVAARKSPPIPATLLAVIQKGPFSASVRAAQLGREGGGRRAVRRGSQGVGLSCDHCTKEKSEKQDRAPRLQPARRRANLLLPDQPAVETAVQQRKGARPLLLPHFPPLVWDLGNSWDRPLVNFHSGQNLEFRS